MTTNRPRQRLLVLASTYPRWHGDAEPGFVHELAKRLVGDFDVTVLCPHAPGAPAAEIMDGVRVIRYRYAPAALETLVNDGGIVTNLKRFPWKWLLLPGFLLSLFFRTWVLVRQDRQDVIHAHWLIPQGLVVALLGLITKRMPPFLVTSHGADLFALRGKPMVVMKRLVLRRAGAATVVSKAMVETVGQLGGAKIPVEIQPMGVDLSSRFTPSSSEQRSGTELLFVGRLVEKKGLCHLVDAMPAILARFPDVTLTVAGFGPEREALDLQVEKLGLKTNVRFIGPVKQDELPALYRRAAAFVAPFTEARDGDQEGLGLVLVEALGCGCPVVTTRVPAVQEVFGGKWPAFAATPGSAESIAEQVTNLLEAQSDARAWVASNADALHGRFDWANVASGYSRILSDMVRAAG